MKLCAIDFEFKRPSNPDMGLISVSIRGEDFDTETYWLWGGEQKRDFCSRIYKLKDTHIFVGYSIQQAEARCIAALGIDPNKMKWRDLMIEWRWLRNGDYRYSYGKTMQNGFPKYTVPPKARVGKKASQEQIDEAKAINDEYLADIKADLDEGEDEVGMQEVGWSMLDCSYFFEVISSKTYNLSAEVKARVRDGIIINGTDQDIVDNREDICDYNSADVGELLELAEAITKAMNEVASEPHIIALKGEVDFIDLEDRVPEIQLMLGDWSARLAKYGQRGIPMHRGRLDRLLEVVPKLTMDTMQEWNRQYPLTPLYRIGFSEKILGLRTQPCKQSPYINGDMTRDDGMMEGIIEEYLRTSGLEKYPRTRSGKPDCSKKVIDRFASGENILKQFQRHQGQLSTLKTYSPNAKGHIEALDYIGCDDRQRPDFGTCGTQTMRNAAKAKSLCFLGPHWLRVLVEPKPGSAIIELDYGSEEVFIAASVADDQNMKNAYASNDVYMYYAALVGMYPKELPIPTEDQRNEPWFAPYDSVRGICKTLNLSMQFGAGAKSVAAAVRDANKGVTVTDEDGENWVSDYYTTYADYAHAVNNIRRKYKDERRSLALSNGWRMGLDNPSVLSAGNLPIQGGGSVILQTACKLIDDAGYRIIATLHDAITLECDEKDAEAVAKHCSQLMKDAARMVLGEEGMKVGHAEIIRHGELWLHSKRAKVAWNRLKVNFEGVYKE